LQLQKEHIAAMGGSVSFTPGRFNTGAGEETSIVTSSGAFIISWSLQKVKQGKLNTYRVWTSSSLKIMHFQKEKITNINLMRLD